eukprot:gene8732-1115_t
MTSTSSTSTTTSTTIATSTRTSVTTGQLRTHALTRVLLDGWTDGSSASGINCSSASGINCSRGSATSVMETMTRHDDLDDKKPSAPIQGAYEGLLASSGVNGDTECLDWNTQEDIIAYAASSFLFIVENTARMDHPQRVVQTCPGHTDRINCVRWMKQLTKNGGAVFFPIVITGSTDKTLRVWTFKAEVGWMNQEILEGHEASVTNIDTLTFDNGRMVVASSGGDETVRIWTKDKDHVLSVVMTAYQGEKIDTPRHFIFSLGMGLLPETQQLFLACGGDDMRVRVYAAGSNGRLEFQDALQGHEDWIRSITVTYVKDQNQTALLVASAAQDGFIRLWKIVRLENAEKTTRKDEFESLLQTSERHFSVDETMFCSSFEALLAGHDNKVFSVTWSPEDNHIALLSASSDKTAVVWVFDEKENLWVEDVRVGEVGGNTLGFFGARFGPSGNHILAYSFHGAMHQWSRCESGIWKPQVVVSGHYKGVYDLDWSPNGDFLLTVSDDQTTRLFSVWKNSKLIHTDSDYTWHEISRPQVHGYDMRCIAVIDDSSFASGADEKVLRVFEAPTNFFDTFSSISGQTLCEQRSSAGVKGRAFGASVPALGLSNKPVYEEDSQMETSSSEKNEQYFRSTTEDTVYPFKHTSIQHPPFETQLVQNTLWPEVRKLYGHGYELLCVACDHSKTLLASACKATKPEHALIRLWSLQTGLEVCQLPGHNLSVIKMAFSPDDHWLVSVSRDRSICIFKRTETDVGPRYKPSSCKLKAHDRIIWDISWINENMFVSASRDKQVKAWRVSDDGEPIHIATLPKFEDSVTAVSVTKLSESTHDYCLAVGLNNGSLSTFRSSDGKKWCIWHTLPPNLAHQGTVRCLKWRPRCISSVDDQGVCLASCSLDHLVRVTKFFL